MTWFGVLFIITLITFLIAIIALIVYKKSGEKKIFGYISACVGALTTIVGMLLDDTFIDVLPAGDASISLQQEIILNPNFNKFEIYYTLNRGEDVRKNGIKYSGKINISENDIENDTITIQYCAKFWGVWFDEGVKTYEVTNIPSQSADEAVTTISPVVTTARPSTENYTTTTTIESSSIPETAAEFHGHCYQLYDDVVDSWESAKKYCESLGGHLAVINDSDENDFLYSYIINQGYSSAYFGYTDHKNEGAWSWVNNINSSYTNWAKSEPNSENSNEDYAMFYSKYTDGKWNDGRFGKKSAFLCEWDKMNYSHTKLINTVELDMNAEIERCFNDFDYDGASSYLEQLYHTYRFECVYDKIQNLEDDFVSHSLEIAEDDAKNKNYEAAYDTIHQAILIIGKDNEKLNSACANYHSRLAVYITDLEYMDCENDVHTQNVLEDNIGNLYHNGLFMSRDISFIGDRGWYGEAWAEYYIQGKYSTFSGTVAVPNGYEGTKCSAYFEVYGDGNLLYTSPLMKRDSFPESFSFDINSVKVLKILYPESNDRADMATIYDGSLLPAEFIAEPN